MFNHLCGKKVIIYGTGPKTEELLKNEINLQIIGLMDPVMTGEIVFGKKVLDYVEAKEADAIIIAAGNAVLRIIYKRIKYFSQKNNIEIFDLAGNRIDMNISGVSRSVTRFSYNDLIKDINYHDIITFDIFDTLIMRQIYRQADIYRIIERRLKEKYDVDIPFFSVRIKSEKELSVVGVPDIDEIYRHMNLSLGLSEYVLRLVMQEEMDTEYAFIIPRRKMVEAYDYAVKTGKKVYLVSDMFFHKDFIKQLLDKCGIRDYTDIFISCEYKCSKTGKLFSIVKKTAGRGRYLHIGDDKKADITRPAAFGINTFRVFSAVDLYEHSLFTKNQCIYSSKDSIIENSIVLGMFVSRAFNDPFVLYGSDGRYKVDKEEKLGELFVAPVIMAYTVWLIKQIKTDSITNVLYPSRDGYLIKRLVELVTDNTDCETPEGRYFYTSRYAAINGNIFYKKYVRKSINENRTALVDFLAEGTIQYNLIRVSNKPVVCYYFLKRISSHEDYNSMEYRSFFSSQGPYEGGDNVYRGYLLLETILSSYEPSFRNLTGNDKKIFFSESRSKEQIQSLRYIHNSIERYFSDYVKLDNRLFDRNFDRALADMLYGYIFSEYTRITSDNINSLELTDEFRKKTLKSTSQI